MPQPHVREWRKLSDAQRDAWSGFVRAATEILATMDAELAEERLTLSEYNVLLALSATTDGWMRMGELAETIAMSRSGLTRLVDRLQKSGLVRRYSDDDDARAVYAAITARGVARLAETSRSHVAAVRERFASRLSESEARQLARICQRLVG